MNRARRCARKGKWRKAAVAMRERCALDGDAASWVMLGSMLARARRRDEAVRAYKQGAWLHRRAGAERRAETVGRLIEQLRLAAA